jgi:hypothetical protein
MFAAISSFVSIAAPLCSRGTLSAAIGDKTPKQRRAGFHCARVKVKLYRV